MALTVNPIVQLRALTTLGLTLHLSVHPSQTIEASGAGYRAVPLTAWTVEGKRALHREIVFTFSGALGTVYDASSTNAVFSLQSSSSWSSTAWIGYPETHPGGGLEQLDIVSTLAGSVPIRLDYRYRDSDQQLAGVISTKRGTTISTLQDLSYRYDVAGNLRGIDDALGELSQEFQYDELHRIVRAQGTGSSGYGTNSYVRAQ